MEILTICACGTTMHRIHLCQGYNADIIIPLLAGYRNLAFKQAPSRGLSHGANCNGQYRRPEAKDSTHHLCKRTVGSGGKMLVLWHY